MADYNEVGCFHFGDITGLDWYDALRYCHEMGAYLAEVHDDLTRQILKAYVDSISGDTHYWWWSGANAVREVCVMFIQ